MVDQHRLFPGLGQAALAGGFDHLAADRHDGAHQRERAEAGRPCMPPIGAPRGRMAEKSSSSAWPRAPREGHALDHLDRLGLQPSRAVLDGDADGMRRGVLRRRPFAGDEIADRRLVGPGLGGAPGQQAEFGAEAVQHGAAARVVGMVRREVQQHLRRLRPVHRHQRVVIGAAAAGAVQQQVELCEGGDRRRAVVKTSMLRLACCASPCCRCRPEVISAPVAMALRSRSRSMRVARRRLAAEQRHVAFRDAVGDAAEAFPGPRGGRRCGGRRPGPCRHRAGAAAASPRRRSPPAAAARSRSAPGGHRPAFRPSRSVPSAGGPPSGPPASREAIRDSLSTSPDMVCARPINH